ncbi:hypothetical protein [Psychrobacillus antarcticus]|uniref:hypothetical protein n=1 Tax=Psychrobacillus antarcticus TaxID=2879115 RepID=UPI002407DAB3|nr:hypothetical protein [Psychrobacillus antarcticus]
MMKKLHNEKGYTLILTLVIITIIVIFFSSFTLSAMNQQKQVEKTDETYEVTAIAEMGVEYYQAAIINLIAKYSQDTINAITANNGLPQNIQRSLDTIKQEYLAALKTEILNLSNNTAIKKITLDDESTYFLLADSNEFKPKFISNILLEINVVGKIKNKEKRLTAYFNFPTDLITFPTGNTGGAGGGNTGNPQNSFEIPRHLFFETIPTQVCKNPMSSNNVPCKTNDLSTFLNLSNNIVYYPENSSKSFNPLNLTINKNFNNSFIFTNGTNSFNDLKGAKNLTIESTGSTTFKLLDSTENISLFMKGNGNFNNNLGGKNFTLYGAGDQVFESTVNFESGKFSVIGYTLFKKNADFINTIFEIENNVDFKDVSNFTGSKIDILGNALFNYNAKFNTTSVNIFGNATFNNPVEFNGAKNSNISGTSLFKNNLNISNSTINFGNNVTGPSITIGNKSTVCFRKLATQNPIWGTFLNIDSTSNVYMDESLKGTIYSTNGKQPNFVSKNELDILCPSGNQAPKPEPEPKPIIENDFINNVIYN